MLASASCGCAATIDVYDADQVMLAYLISVVPLLVVILVGLILTEGGK